jgi:hypothetical protein
MVTLMIPITTRISGELTGAFFMLAIGIPFLVVYLVNRKNWWALIPAGVLLLIAAIILISTQANAEIVAPLILFAIALPFFIVYFRTVENWWALIPAGVLTSVGITLVLSMFEVLNLENSSLMNALIWLGIAVTFGILWLRRVQHGTDWAKYPCHRLIVALVVLVVGAGDLLLPALLIAGEWWCCSPCSAGEVVYLPQLYPSLLSGQVLCWFKPAESLNPMDISSDSPIFMVNSVWGG